MRGTAAAQGTQVGTRQAAAASVGARVGGHPVSGRASLHQGPGNRSTSKNKLVFLSLSGFQTFLMEAHVAFLIEN